MRRGNVEVSPTGTRLTRQQFQRAAYIGCFRHPNRPQQSIPVRELDGRRYDLLGQEILNFDKLVEVKP